MENIHPREMNFVNRTPVVSVEIDSFPFYCEKDAQLKNVEAEHDYLSPLKIRESVGTGYAVVAMFRGRGLGWAKTRAYRFAKQEALKRGADVGIVRKIATGNDGLEKAKFLDIDLYRKKQ